jgi:spermidine synthase
VTLSEEDGVRYLHFGSPWVQGAMRIARPWQLQLAYQRQMMACALFLPEPTRIVQLGLGAAALTKFCYRHVPGAHITAVELSERVIDTARRSFALPPDDERLAIVQSDARDFLSDRRGAGRADWLQVDLYDAAARGPVYDDVGFYALCRRALRRPGIACFNLFGRRFEPSLQAIQAAFGMHVVALPEVDEGNRIVFGLQARGFEESLAVLERRARELEAAWKLPFARWLTDLSRERTHGDMLRI